MDTIYLDHAATTPLDRAVAEAMLPFLSSTFGNPSSPYMLGQDARAAVDRARATVSRLLGCAPSEVIFTSGSTESDNLALSGVAWAAKLGNPGATPHIVTTVIEHSAVLETARWLERIGFGLTIVGCTHEGLVEAADIEAAIRPETCLVSVMYANNEVGSIQPVREIAQICRNRGVPLHVDATQAAGLLPLDVDTLGVDLMSLSAHKFYGPKGVGLLYVRSGTSIEWQQHGGGQESGRRGGTENVAGMVGFALALEAAERFRPAYGEHCRSIRDRLHSELLGAVPDVKVNGPADPEKRLANNLNVSIRGVQGETLLLNLDLAGIAASAGSACTTGNTQPSHVLLAMGLSGEEARSSVRFTVGRSNTLNQVDDVIAAVAEAVGRIRSMAAAPIR